MNFHMHLIWPALLLFSLIPRAQCADSIDSNSISRGPAVPRLLPADDSEILVGVHDTDLLEIRAGEMAESKGSSALVRAYGLRLARDHKMIDDSAFRTAYSLGVLVKAESLSGRPDKLQKLERASGRNFDLEFMGMMVEGHLQAITMLSKYYEQQRAGSKMRAFLGRVIPILKQHLEVAENLQPWI